MIVIAHRIDRMPPWQVLNYGSHADVATGSVWDRVFEIDPDGGPGGIREYMLAPSRWVESKPTPEWGVAASLRDTNTTREIEALERDLDVANKRIANLEDVVRRQSSRIGEYSNFADSISTMIEGVVEGALRELRRSQ